MAQPLEDTREGLNVLYCGDGGTGKTTDIAALARMGKVLLINAESGIKKKALERMDIPTENIEVFPGEGEELTFDALEAEWLRVREALNEDPEAYVGVGWDSGTEIQTALKDAVVEQAMMKAERRGVERSRWIVNQDDRTQTNDQMRTLIRRFRDLPCHFAVTTLLRREQDDDGKVTYQPAVTPAIQNDLIGWVDIVCVTSVAAVGEDEQYRGLFRPHGKFRGKDRWKILPKWLIDPTFDRLVEYVYEEVTVDTDPVMEAARKAALAAKDGSGDPEETKETVKD